LARENLRIFDTTFIVDLVNSDPGAVKVAEEQSRQTEPAVISAVTVHEYLLGVHLRYRDSRELGVKVASANRDLSPFEVLPLTRDVAEESARLHSSLTGAGRQIGINDVYIAATALKYGLELVTRDRRHFARIPSLRLVTY
jgi:tRNA(fMet)-specific endonuclease VapC